MWYNVRMQKTEMKLRPTLWRTCRALMNATRLRMLRLAIEGDGALCVRDYARGLGLTDAVASIYLRQLNARGLLGVRRDRIKVFYNGEQDRSLPDSMALQAALRSFFATDPKQGWESEIMTILRAFSHFNRLAILIRLADGPATLDDLFKAMGVCVKSVYHHLGFLHAAGLIEERRAYHRPSSFSMVWPAHPFAETLLRLVLQSAGKGESYYNVGSGRDPDRATKTILRKIAQAEHDPRKNWRSCGPKRPKRKTMSSRTVKALADDDE